MENEKVIPITNGVGSVELVNGTYTVSSLTTGYDNTSILPAEVEVVEGTDTYSFTIAATGTLTLHVSDDGTDVGIPVVGAKFKRCDAEGTEYGDEITSDSDGNAVFNNVPYSEGETVPVVYYKQTASDLSHDFDSSLKDTTLTAETATIEVENTPATERNFNFTDANYSGLPIADGQIILS